MLVADPVAPGRQRVKLLDFGVAKLASSSSSKTGASVIMGTPRYMSPEQCRGSGLLDDRSDCYSLGVLLFEMLSGRLPFLGEGAGELIAQHMYKAPPSLGEVTHKLPQALVDLVDRLLRKTPTDRPAMAEVARLLEGMLEDSGSRVERGGSGGKADVQTTEDVVPVEPRSSTLRGELSDESRSSVLIGALGALGLLLLVGAVVLVRSAGHPNQRGSPIADTLATKGAGSGQAGPIPKQPPPRRIVWRLISTPPGATAVDSLGLELGITPLTIERATAEGSESVTLRMVGYADKALMLKRDQDCEVNESLRPLPKKAVRNKKERDASRSQDATQPMRRTSYED